jgi:hypothetical protein
MKNKRVSVIIALLFSVLLISMNSHAQEIKKVINYGWGLGDKDPYKKRGFTLQITCDSLPELNKTSRISVKIRSKVRHQNAPRFGITGSEQSVDYTQLEPEWFPPINPEDIYEGSFTITPREIGTFGLYIRAWGKPFRSNSHNTFGLWFTIDETGKTIHFSDIEDYDYRDNGPPAHPPIVNDLIYIRSYRWSDFENAFRIVPSLKLNDTSTIHIELKSNHYCPDGVLFFFTLTSNLEMIRLPSSCVGELKEGEVYKDSFQIMPTTTDLAFLSMRVEGNSPSKDVLDKRRGVATATFNLHFSFDSSGRLDYVGREDKYYRHGRKSPREVAASLGEEYREAKGALKRFWSEPVIPIKKKK